MDHAEFRARAHQMADWIADYLETVGDRRVVSEARPGEIRGALAGAPPEQGEAFDRIFADFERVVVPGLTHWQHPGWFGYFASNSSPPSVLAEMLVAGLAVNGIAWQTSPAATELEQVALDWLRQLIGLPEGFHGVIQDTASTATLTAVLTARDAAWARAGRSPVLSCYASDEAHSSVFKAARLAGFMPEGIRRVPTDESFAMRADELREMLAEDQARGWVPACVVATVGTTSSTALDPVRAIGTVARDVGAFFHVDAAYGGAAAVAPEHRAILDGVELADSFVVNPHKWLLTNFDCSAYYVRDPDLLMRSFAALPEYLKTVADSEVVNFRDWGIPLGRRFRALKLWFVLRSYGAEGLRALVREHIRLAALFAGWVDAALRWQRMAPVPLGLVCFRHVPAGMTDGPELDAHNRRILEFLNASGEVFLTHTTLRGRFTIRLAVGQRTTEEHHVRRAWDLARSAVAEGVRGHSGLK